LQVKGKSTGRTIAFSFGWASEKQSCLQKF